MGICTSNNAHPLSSVSEDEKVAHKQAERELKDQQKKLNMQSKVHDDPDTRGWQGIRYYGRMG
jgi:hypothetical protein